ncbi:hypothetical protein ACFXDH_16740 [Streptomyces sp. NPDC059467]|uniref:hypothetical protein n=1 Tax=Streptomyces sp. NPDC059467 TaxID=3346844 RepID=UPI003685424B
MSRYDLASEAQRLERRSSEEPISLFGLLVVTPVADAREYAERLRGVIAGAVEISRSVDFESDDVSADLLPPWFLKLSDGSGEGVQGDPVGSEGKARYLTVREDRAWDAGEWIYSFDPDLRAWSWWDITTDDHGAACVWIDTKGEGRIPCEELWWAIFVAGAAAVDPLTLEESSVWIQQRSIGLKN